MDEKTIKKWKLEQDHPELFLICDTYDLLFLIERYEKNSGIIEVWRKMTEVQWKEFYGLAGIQIYNYLNPTKEEITPKCILFEFKGKISGSKSVKGIRKSLYRWAQNQCGYYHPSNNSFSYQDDDMVVDILFKAEQLALNFQTEFEFISTNISYSQLQTESKVNSIDYLPISRRILLKDYNSGETDSPDDSMFSQSEFTEYHPTDDMVRYQSIERIDWLEFGSEGAHLIASHVCKKSVKFLHLDKSENNRLALSRQLHGYVDGLSNGNKPVVKLNYVPSNEEFVDGRYRVVIGVQFLNSKVKALVQPLLKPASRHTSDPLIMECDVYVRDKEEFIQNLQFKSNETEKIWNDLEYI